MRTTPFALCCWLTLAVACQAQPITAPAWFRAGPAPAIPPDAGVLPQEAASPPSPSYFTMGLQDGQNIADAITPEIQALARGLQNDPAQIYYWVHDYISYVLYFGSKKGAQLTLLERKGNDFDQCALLVALLRAAGYSPQYQFGGMGIPYDATDGTENDLHHWLCLSLVNTNWGYTSNYLVNLFCGARGYPAYNFLNDNNTMLFQRVWVVLPLGGTNCYLDPAFKVSEPVAGINLPTAMNFSSNALMSAAQGVDTGNYATNLNEAAIRINLTSCQTTLAGYMQDNCPNVSVPEILSGWYRPVNYWYETALPKGLLFQTYLPMTNWLSLPTNLMSSLAISFAGTNYQWLMPQLQGQRLSLTYDSSGTAQLWQDDTLLAQHSTTSADTNVVLSVNHPFGYWNYVTNGLVDTGQGDQVVTNSYQRSNATYALIYAFEPDWAWLRERQDQLDAYRQQGLGDTSRQVVSETLNVMGLSWMVQTAQAEQLTAAQMGILPQYHHRLGRMAQEAGRGYYVDVYMQNDGEASNAGSDAANEDREDRHFDLTSYFHSAFEHGIIEQLQATNLVGASTVKMLQLANTNGQAVYLASSTNWTTGANVRTKLGHYSTSALATLDSLITKGYYVLLPQNGSNEVAGAGSWAGCAYGARLNTSSNHVVLMAVAGGYNGGFASDPNATADPVFVSETGQAQPRSLTAAPVSAPALRTGDPVNLADGTFEVETTDLSLGQAEPRGIKLSRYYNGRRRYSNPAGMAPGWVHNYCVKAVETSAPEAALGQTTPGQMAPMLVATCAAIGVYNGARPDPKNWLVTHLIAKWGIDQLTRNAVSVILGRETLQFVKQPDSTVTPPANCTWGLSKGYGYMLLERHGSIFYFDTLGRLSSIEDPYSESLSVSYLSSTSSLPQTVTDWKGRTLTFNYTGGQLTSVADGAGRSVAYGYSTAYSSQGDLTSVTDPETKTSTYTYDTNHQITATFDALSRLVVSNIYDSQGRIGTQYTQGDTNRAWQVYWGGRVNAQQDPAGGVRLYYYDEKTRPIGFRDELGDWTDTYYDGQDHVIATDSPLYEWTEFDYDGNHNLVQRVDPLGNPRKFSYDSQYHLIRSVDERGNTNRFGYNVESSLTGSTNGAGDWVAFDYNADGTLHTRTDSAGTTTYSYDSYGQVSGVMHPNGLGGEGFFNSAAGDVLTHTNARGFATSFLYNSRRQLTNTVAPTNLTAKVAYDAVGNQQSVTDARGATTTSFWSPTRHRTSTVFPSTPQGVPATTNLYDSRDWLARSVDPLQKPTLFTNDLAGRLLSTTDPLLRTTRFGYDADGHQTAATNAAQEATLQQWDARGELIKLTDPATHSVLRAYDAAGNQTILTNRNGKEWQFLFDGANRLTNTITPQGYHFGKSYNDRGLVESVADDSGHTVWFYYDALGRLTNRSDAWATEGVLAQTAYSLDANNNLTSVTNAGQAGRLSWGYDAYDRVSAFTNADGYVIQYRYDANGNLTNLIYPGNRTVAYAYDTLNRLTNVTDWSSRTTTLAYDLANRVTSITRPNNTVRAINYDAGGETTNIIEKTTTGFPIAFFTLGWTNSGRVAWEFGAPLPHSNAPPTRTMTYDGDNRLATLNGQNLEYDGAGSVSFGPLTNNTLVAYYYDVRNRLLSAGGPSYGYDPAGNRTSITLGTSTTHFVINPNVALSQVLMRVNGGTTNYYIYGLGLLYEIDETATVTNMLTYHYDYRGSTIAVTDGSGSIRERFEYSTYGMLTYRSGSTDTPFLYNGRCGVQTDPNGLLYMRARYYNPYLCRFINPDPAGFAGGLNWYCYADGNPISLIDPFGLCAVGETGGGSRLTSAAESVANFLEDVEWQDRQHYLAPKGPVTDGLPFVGNFVNASSAAWRGDVAATDRYANQLGGEGLATLLTAGMAKFLPAPTAEGTVGQGTRVFRVWGDEAKAYGRSWTTIDPRTVGNYRNVAGLPSQNTGRFLSEGILQDTTGVQLKAADPLDGNMGGLPEVVIPNPAQQINLQNVQGLNPQF